MSTFFTIIVMVVSCCSVIVVSSICHLTINVYGHLKCNIVVYSFILIKPSLFVILCFYDMFQTVIVEVHKSILSYE